MAEKAKRNIPLATKVKRIDKKIEKLNSQIAELEKEKAKLLEDIKKQDVEKLVAQIKASGIDPEEIKAML